MKNINFPDYTYEIIENILIIFDLNLGKMTVTNGIEWVLQDIKKSIPLRAKMIIYRDSIGQYNRLITTPAGEFIGFEFNIMPAVWSLIGRAFLEDMYNHKRLAITGSPPPPEKPKSDSRWCLEDTP